jgi:dTMP kinase|tara:strand:+ start:289 stop:870 length:582 start_codon:yes stop_codon:yes gene_type:complete
LIITFEGGDQAGKKTQSAMLQRKLRLAKLKTKLFSFPDYTTPIGKEIDRYLHGKRKYPAQVIHCLLAANRWERASDLQDAKEKNSVIIMNRYRESNLVYGITNGLKLAWLEKLDEGLPKSDLVIVLDVPQKESFARKKQNRDKFEKNKQFSNKISQGYRKLAKKKRWKVVDASQSKDEVHKDVMKIVAKKMGL